MRRFSKGSELLSRRPRFLPLGVAALLSAGIALTAQAQSITFDGDTFVNKGLVAVARLPSDAKDKQGDTLGGIGSGMAPRSRLMAARRRCLSRHDLHAAGSRLEHRGHRRFPGPPAGLRCGADA